MAVIVAEVLLSLFAVFGLYAAVRLLAATFFDPAHMGVVLEIRRSMSLSELEKLVARAGEQFFLRSSGGIVALIDASLETDETMALFLEKEGVICYYTEFENEGEGG